MQKSPFPFIAGLIATTISLVTAGAAAALPQERVGTVTFPNSGAAAAHGDFLYGVAQLHNFQYDDAARAFRRAQDIDPGFALAYWGEAMTYTHPIWQEQDLAAARAVMVRLGASLELRLAAAPTERERDLLLAIETLYGDGAKQDRDDAYALAMEQLHDKYPADPEIGAFTALAILGTAHEGRDFATYMRAAAIVEDVFRENPQHPGAAHYLIHSYDDPIHAPLGLRAARAYSEIAPDAGHAQHMCSHIFVAVGMWDDVVQANLNATAAVARAAARTGRTAPACGHYTTWLNYGYLQTGDYAKAAELTATCHAAAHAAGEQGPAFDPDNSAAASFITMQARYLIDTQHWDSEVARLAVELVPDQVQERMTIAFVNGLAAARQGNLAGAAAALDVIREARAGTERLAADGTLTYALEARGRSAVLEAQMTALVRQLEGDFDAAIELAVEAAELEEAMPFMFGPPFIDKPSYELLGEILLAAGRNDEASAAFRVALGRTPGRAAALRGLDAASR